MLIIGNNVHFGALTQAFTRLSDRFDISCDVKVLTGDDGGLKNNNNTALKSLKSENHRCGRENPDSSRDCMCSELLRLLQEKGAALQPRWVMEPQTLQAGVLDSPGPPGPTRLTLGRNFSQPSSFSSSWFLTFHLHQIVLFFCFRFFFFNRLSWKKPQKLQEVWIAHLHVAHDLHTAHFVSGTEDSSGQERTGAAWCCCCCGSWSGEALVDAGTQPCPVPQGWRHCRLWVVPPRPPRMGLGGPDAASKPSKVREFLGIWLSFGNRSL